MHKLSVTLLAVATTAALASAQNDDCSGALQVVQGANGPFTNAGSTTSFPWTCAFGDNDVWFLYVSPGTGTLTADVCGTSMDTVMELFDGASGCGSLATLDCNDDTCALASSVTASVVTGGTYYIRVGGYAGDIGTFTLNVNGPAGSGSVATATQVGTGCIRQFASFYEIESSASFDLSNTTMTLIHLQPGYLALATGGFVAPTAGATALTLGDDDEVVQSLTTPFPYDGGTATSLNICSNGFVSVASNGTDYFPDVQAFLSAPETGWWVWHDMDPSLAGSGQVKFEEIGSVAYVTWDGVYDYGGVSAAEANTFQLQFDSSTGSVTFAWQTMSLTGDDFLVGYSPGGASADPGDTDLSVAVPSASLQVAGVDVLPLTLASTTRPKTGTTWSMNVSNIPANGVIGVEVFGLANPNIPDLAFLGMPTCGLYSTLDFMNAFVVTGSSHAYGLVLPANPGLVGVHVYATSAVFQAPPVNAFGAISSNGLDGLIGNL